MTLFTRSLAAAAFAIALLASSLDASAQAPTTVSLPPSARVPRPVFPPGAGAGNVGKSADISGNMLLLGASGKALMYEETTPGNWEFMQLLQVPIYSHNAGQSVAIDGNLAVIGAPWDGDDICNGESGAALYSFDGTTWNVDLAATGSPDWGLGGSVALSGDTVLIGEPYGGSTAIAFGAVHFRQLSGTQWNHVPISGGLTPFLCCFRGLSVAISGDVAATNNASGQNTEVVIYRRAATTWTVDQVINLPSTPGLAAQGLGGSGRQVALDGNTLLVQVSGPLPNSEFRVGIAVFEDLGSGFVYRQFLEASDTTSSLEGFGRDDFDIHGDYIVAGAHDTQPRGTAYLFRRGANGLFSEQAKLVPSGGEWISGSGTRYGPEFGYSVALSDDKVVIGARLDEGYGTAYVLPLGGSTGVGDFEAFCFGNRRTSPACTDCPCGNNADSGIVGGCLNSSGTSAALSILGQASATNDTARLELARATPAVLTLLASSESMLPLNPGATPCPRGSGIRSAFFDGLRCIGGPIVRHGTRMTDATGAVEGDTGGWGGQFEPVGGLVAQGSFAIGQQRFFQAIYRDDPTLGCGTGLNTSNAVAIQVVP